MGKVDKRQKHFHKRKRRSSLSCFVDPGKILSLILLLSRKMRSIDKRRKCSFLYKFQRKIVCFSIAVLLLLIYSSITIYRKSSLSPVLLAFPPPRSASLGNFFKYFIDHYDWKTDQTRYNKSLFDEIDNYWKYNNWSNASNNYSGKSLIFWTSDLHEGGRIDAPSVLQWLGYRVIVNGHKGHQSPYPQVQERFIIPEARSPVINSLIYHTQHLYEIDVMLNFYYYRNDPLLAMTDAFICTFPASYCELWMPFNKSIIFYPTHRFFLSRCTPDRMHRLIDHILAMNASTSPKHFIAAGGVYDAEYINYYTGLTPIVLEAGALFYAGREATKFTQKRREILIGPLQKMFISNETADELTESISRKSIKENWTFTTAKELYGRYELQNVADHRAAVLFPYAVLSYGMSELYAMAIPLLVPSVEMLIDRGWVYDRCMIDSFYCGNQTIMPPKHPNSRHPYSPETYHRDAQRYWLDFADFNQWPHVTYFDSLDDLIDKLETMNFTDIHFKMVEANKKREATLLERWNEIAKQIDQGRNVPQDYKEALNKMWNTSVLQSN